MVATLHRAKLQGATRRVQKTTLHYIDIRSKPAVCIDSWAHTSKFRCRSQSFQGHR